jgi:S-adenosylmethionine hydrolase
MKIITLTTDFGDIDGYPATMKGVIFRINPHVRIFDISHSILPQNIIQGAYVLSTVVDYYPLSIHLGVVDPGVGTEREGLIFNCKNGVLVGPDNGLLVPAAKNLEIIDVYKISNEDFWLSDVSSTFHGRDIFAPVAAHISKGIIPEELGEKTDQFVDLDIFNVSEKPNIISGMVVNIDRFGNIITNINKEIVNRNYRIGDEVTISVKHKIESQTQTENNDQEKIHQILFKTTYNDVPKNSLVAIISSGGFLEIAGNQCKANEVLNLQISDIIELIK